MSARTLKTQGGFSLIELMIVVAIIGILASIAVPNFQKFQRRAKQSEGKGYLNNIFTAEKGFIAEWNSYSSDLACIGFKDLTIPAPANGISGKGSYITGFSATTNGPVTGTPCIAGNNQANPQAANGVVFPALGAGTVATPTTFTAVATGALGGAANDNWTITEQKIIANTVSGL